MESFKAFGEAQAITLGDLTLESDESQLALYGKLTLLADQPSQERLDHLIALLTQARADLASAIARGDAPDPGPDKPLPSVKNPFA
ncbi:hypothetical protein [Novosphingobium sp.]|uniref:hypothetical protein n=1 Tax=Novosphingobium sp. TaxID=1874826 RepID=UPI0031DD1CEB